MKEFDRWRRRILILAVSVAVFIWYFSDSLITATKTAALAAGFLYLFIIIILIITNRCNWSFMYGWWTTCFEMCTVYFFTVVTEQFALLFFIPIQSARMVSLVPKKSEWLRRLSLFVPLLPALSAEALMLPLIKFSIDNIFHFSFLPLSALAGAGTASITLLIQKREEEKRVPLKKSLAAKDAILSTLTHEIRTPLTVIQSTIDIMMEGRTGPLTPQQQKFLSSVDSNIRRLVSLSETILASIKVESNWFSVQLSPIDIRRVIKKVVLHMKPVTEENQLHLSYSFPQIISRPLADENWIYQVLVNLVHNSIKHLHPQGKINISVNENEQGIVVSVSDNGEGIKTKERLKVFDEFFQGDLYSAANLNGAGLGLSIVKRVVEKHNGRIYFGSVKGLGTTVSFTLPVERKEDYNEG